MSFKIMQELIFFVINCGATIVLPLRRTLVRLGGLFSFKTTTDGWFLAAHRCSNVQVCDATGDDQNYCSR